MLIAEPKSLQLFRKAERLMGNHFEFTILDESNEIAEERFELAIGEIKRIEKLLTTFNDNSQTNQINNNAGLKAVQVSREVFELISRSIRLSELTDGAFDITYGSIDKRLWNFDSSMTSLPNKETAKKMVRLINYRNILLDKENYSVMLKEKGMRIGFGGIGKGYAADMAKKILVNAGVKSGIVNASGDLVTWGNQPDDSPWTIGIAHPDYTNLPFSYLHISDIAIATSGNYEKFVTIDGKKYSHTINPKTGLPVTGIKSVTILSPIAEIADALATAVTIKGIKSGLHMINQVNNVECLIVDDENNVFTSSKINLS
jgi:thiamine biosynthesis lipoprotein